MRWKPRLSTILLVINIIILLLPLGGIGVLRIYESELIRRTESELIAQATLIGAAYREALIHANQPASTDTLPHPASPAYGIALAYKEPALNDKTQKYHPISPKLDIANEIIRPLGQPTVAASEPADNFAVEAARQVEPLLSASKDVTLVGIRLLDFRGTVVASTGSEVGSSMLVREEARRALSGEYVSLLRQRLSDKPQPPATSISRGKLLRVFVAMPVIHNGRVLGAVVISRTPLDIRKSLYLVRDQLAVAMAGLLAVVLIITIITSITVNRPLKALVKHAERVVDGEKASATTLESSGIYEIGQLSQAVSTMAATLEERGEYIRTFAANVSHEFKTPLTSIRGTVELMEDHFQDMSTDERHRFTRIIASDTERLDRLVRRLLDLARADTFSPGDERTNVSETLDSLKQRFQELSISILTESNMADPAIRMAPETFESIIANMIENARQHGGESVAIEISVKTAFNADGSFLELDIHDNGPGIPAANQEKIFRPFFTTAREKGGSGLGLSIVRSLLMAHGGSINLQSNEHGAFFRLMLPTAN